MMPALYAVSICTRVANSSCPMRVQSTNSEGYRTQLVAFLLCMASSTECRAILWKSPPVVPHNYFDPCHSGTCNLSLRLCPNTCFCEFLHAVHGLVHKLAEFLRRWTLWCRNAFKSVYDASG